MLYPERLKSGVTALLRPLARNDLPALLAIFKENHTGLTNLPETKEDLTNTLECSHASFSTSITTPGNQLYAFVLEGIPDRKILGISAIAATTGGSHPLYFYKRELLYRNSPSPLIPPALATLQAISYVRGPSALCSLFLMNEARGKGFGKLLSLGRLLYMAQQPQRFTETICTELRGTIDQCGHSLFWEHIGSHFLHMSYTQALKAFKLDRSLPKQFLPLHPIYIDLLPKEAKDALGRPHIETQAALSLLLKEGFSPTDEFDVFDGGPKLACEKSHIRTIAHSTRLLAHCSEGSDDPSCVMPYIIATTGSSFRAIIAPLVVRNTQALLSPHALEALGISENSSIIVAPL